VTLDDLRKFFTPRYVLHLEREVELWRGQNMSLLLQLQEALKPTPVAHIKREFPKFTPKQTSWEAYLAEEIAKQEKEEPSGT
jgi:hypothetical protein